MNSLVISSYRSAANSPATSAVRRVDCNSSARAEASAHSFSPHCHRLKMPIINGSKHTTRLVPPAAIQMMRCCRSGGRARSHGVHSKTKRTMPAARNAATPTISCVMTSDVAVYAPSTVAPTPVATSAMSAVCFEFMWVVKRPNDTGSPTRAARARASPKRFRRVRCIPHG